MKNSLSSNLKYFLCLLFICQFDMIALAQSPAWVWAGAGQETAYSLSSDVAIDKDGNIYLAGDFTSQLTLGDQTVTSAGGKDVFLAKYSSSGTLLWLKTAGGPASDLGASISTDSDGNVYVAGSFQGTISFESQNLTSAGSDDIFLAKYDDNENLIWTKSAGGVDQDMISAKSGRGLYVDCGFLYITGVFRDIANFANVTLSSLGSSDIFFAKYDLNGTMVWAKSAGEKFTDLGADICADEKGNIYLTGYYTTFITVDTFTLNGDGFQDMFIAKFDPVGRAQWVRTATGDLYDFGSAVATDGNAVYVAGEFTSSKSKFGTTTLSNKSSGGYDLFLAKYDSLGNFQWVKQGGWTGTEIATDLAIKDNHIFLTGYFDVAIVFGKDSLLGNGRNDGFVAKFNTNGTIEWLKSIGGSAQDYSYAIAVDNYGFPVVAGRIGSDVAKFDATSVYGPNGIFVAKLGLFPEKVTDVDNKKGLSVYPNPTSGLLYLKNPTAGRYSVQDVQGRTVASGAITRAKPINVQNLPDGVYQLSITDLDSHRVINFSKY